MKKVFILLLFLCVSSLSFSQKQYVPDQILSNIKKSAKEVLGRLPTTQEVQTSILSAKDYTIIVNLRRLCESVTSKSSMTIPEFNLFNEQLKSALNPTTFISMKDEDGNTKYRKIVITGGLGSSTEVCLKNCSNQENQCCEQNPVTNSGLFNNCSINCSTSYLECGLGCINITRENISPTLLAQAIKVEATIEKIYCRNVYDGKNDNTEEVYGWIDVIPGQICFDGDTERHPPVEVNGNGFWKLEPENYTKLKKGQTKKINKKISWKYSLPPNCGMLEGQTVVICRSDLDERDMPHDADDKLEDGCPGCKLNHYCYDQVYLNQVLGIGSKTFRFTQTHSSGGTILEVYFKVIVSSQPPIKGGGIPDTKGNSKK
ncbi:MAG: hypothetical protein WBP08_10520 [Saprospiraceae bacterium]